MNVSMQWLLADAARAVPQARVLGDGAVRIDRVHTDTRSVQPGDLFVALRGERFDATQFLGEAAAKGAVAVLCDATAEPALAACGLPGILVPILGAHLPGKSELATLSAAANATPATDGSAPRPAAAGTAATPE